MNQPKLNKRILTQRHLNYEVRYHVDNKIVTHKSVFFHKDQIHPSVSKCCKGTCVLLLCRSAEENLTVPEKIYNPAMEGFDPLIGKYVKFLYPGDGVTFHNPDTYEEDLDLNWKRLRTMAYPVVDEQLAKLAMAGKWKQKPIRLDLGTLLLDNTVIRFDKQSYVEMEKDGSKDLLQCEVAWGRKIEMELKKRGITKIDNCLVKLKKKKKWSTVCEIDKENAGVNGQEDRKKLPAAVKKEKVPEETSDEWLRRTLMGYRWRYLWKQKKRRVCSLL
jgi:hypothetical protein